MNTHKMRAAILCAIILCAAFLPGCGGGSVESKIEKAVEAKLPDIIGPARLYKVKASGSILEMIGGKLAKLEIHGEDVQTENDVNISILDIILHNAKFNNAAKQIKSIERTDYSAAISEQTLEKYLKKKYPRIPGLKAKIENGKVRIDASPGIGGLTIGIQAYTTLLVRDNRYLDVNLDELNVVGLGTPEIAREYISDRLKSVFDSKDIGFNATVQKVEIANNLIYFKGGLDLMEAVRKQLEKEKNNAATTASR